MRRHRSDGRRHSTQPASDSGYTAGGSLFRLTVGLFIGMASALGVWIAVLDDPLGGQPVAMVELDRWQPSSAFGVSSSELGIRDSLGPDDTLEIVTRAPILEPEIDPLDEQFARMSDANRTAAATPVTYIADLVEDGRDGPLPRISPQGLTPAEAYARPLSARQMDRAKAKVAILIGGMGLSATGTEEAIRQLPEDVTFAFAPYASNLSTWVGKARQNGHEVMLQLPMEPFDYPDSDPGPHTLLTEAGPEENLRRLDWLLSRFTGYFGVTNYMGARFTANPDALRPVLEQLKRRGLVLVDDGTSARSRMAAVGREIGLGVATADVVLDASPSARSIADALARLERLAIERGFAIGVGSGLPVTIESVREWARGLEQKGIVLVPVSATQPGRIS